jgi:hypothetical protein
LKYILIISLFGIIQSSFGQKLKPISFDSLRNYSITYEDSLMDIFGPAWSDHEYERVNADLRIPNTWEPTEINFAEAKLKGDTLYIDFHGYPGHFIETFRITIIKNQYWSNYHFRDDHDFSSKMSVINTNLTLNTNNFQKGTIIKGYTEYVGKCRNCKGTKLIEIKGSFKTLIN